MGCCNQAPNGGTPKLGPLLKAFVIMLLIIGLIAWLFG